MICRGCGVPLYTEDMFCDLGTQPLANALISDPSVSEVHYPLRPLVCRKCLLVQLPVTPEPDWIFNQDYPFYAGQSVTWLAHCRRLADRAIGQFGLGPTSRVLDVGSNDGTMLRRFRGCGIPAIGIEPSEGVAQHAIMEGLSTHIDWWGTACAHRLLATGGIPTGKGWKANLITCTNVLAHVPDLKDFLEGIRMVLAPGGVVIFEVPWIKHLIRDCQFDQIYAEHHSYFSLHSLGKTLERSGLYPFEVEYLPIHGGSVRVYANLNGFYGRGNNHSWLQGFEREKASGLHDPKTYYEFATEPVRVKRRALKLLAERGDKRIVGYGASAKAAVTLNYLGIGPEWMECVADTTPVKWGKYLPGSRIPIVAPNRLKEIQPDVVVLLIWNWADEAIPKIRELCPDAEILVLNRPIAPLPVAKPNLTIAQT